MSTSFRGIDSNGFGGYAFTDQVLHNLKFFIDHNMLGNGAYTTNTYDSSSWYDSDETKLHSVEDNRYSSGCVWEASAREFVWESGVVPGSESVRPSGVYIDGSFYSNDTVGLNTHHIDYLHGRVIFDEPKSGNEDIRLEYVGRYVHTGFADSEAFRIIMLNAVEEFITDTSPSGTPAREHQVWLPSIFIEMGNGSQRGLQLGGGQIKTRFITFHIFADNPNDRNLLTDWLDYQGHTTFWMADMNAIATPFDEYGDIVNGITNWPNMVATYPWKKLRVVNSKPSMINSLNAKLFRSRVVFEIEVDVGGI